MLAWLQEGWILVWCGHIQVVILYHPHHKWGENEHTPHKWAPFCLSLSSRRCQHQPLQIQPPSAPLLPIVFSPERSYRTRCWKDSDTNTHPQQDWTNRASADPATEKDWNPNPAEGSPTDNSWVEPGPAELSWKEVAEGLGKQKRPAGPAQQGGRNSGTDTCAELSPAEQWHSLTQGICHWLSLFQAEGCGKC